MSNLLAKHNCSFSPAKFANEGKTNRNARVPAQLVEKVKISIVIPCYNEKDTIERIAEAVRSAAIESREIIPVDDCSQDGTPEITAKLARMGCRIYEVGISYSGRTYAEGKRSIGKTA